MLFLMGHYSGWVGEALGGPEVPVQYESENLVKVGHVKFLRSSIRLQTGISPLDHIGLV